MDEVREIEDRIADKIRELTALHARIKSLNKDIETLMHHKSLVQKNRLVLNYNKQLDLEEYIEEASNQRQD